jgi:hypothetical protein
MLFEKRKYEIGKLPMKFDSFMWAYFRKNTKLVKWIMSKLFLWDYVQILKQSKIWVFITHLHLKTTKNHFKRI